MTPERWEKVGKIFSSASDLETGERAAYLSEACGGDETLLSEVESLLAAGVEAGRFISQPIVGKFVPEIADHLQALSPGSSIGHFVIEKAIGSGGMGEVYLARDITLDRRVALKTLPPSFASDSAFVRRFRNEARSAANLNHPNVATVHSVDSFDGVPLIVMEHIDGQTLDRLIPENGLDLKRFLDWFEPVADAIAHAHKRGVIHRDVKPGNIMVSADGTPKILDFGLAQYERSLNQSIRTLNDITAPGQIIGTPSYMSPEQAEGGKFDHRSDIFSFGTVMYEALTGKRPFRGATQGLIVRSVVNDEPEPIIDHRPDAPEMLLRMIGKCLEKSPSKRFQSMKEVRSILKEARAASDAGVSMDSFARRFYREATSPSKLWWAATAILVLVLSVGGWYFVSTSTDPPPISLDRVAMRRLSQSNNVAYTTITPDGKSVAYVTLEENGDRALWLRRVSDSNAIQIVPPQPVQYWGWPTFSHDGEHLYYLMAARTATHGTVYRVPTLGGTPRKVVDKVNHLGNVSPDGSRIIFVRYGETNPTLSVNAADAKIISADAVDGENEQVHKTVTGETIFRDPQFSATGDRIVYVKRELSGGVEFWSIAAAPISGEGETEVIKQKERISAIALLGESNGLLMNALDPISNLQQLYHVDIGDGTTTRVTNDLNFYFGVSVDRGGRSIVSSQRSAENRIWIGDAEGMPSLKPLSGELSAYHNVDWTPDGRIVYDAHENNQVHIWIADADGGDAVQLTGTNTYDSDPRVSGDGRYVVFTSRRAGFNQIWRMNIDGSGQVLLANVPGITQRPRFAADGRTVVFRWYNEGSSPLGKVSVDGGPVDGLTELPESVTYSWAMSPDGKYIAYYTVKGATGPSNISIRTVDSPEPIASHTAWPSRMIKWLPDSRRLIYQDVREPSFAQSKLTQMDALTGQTKTFISVEPDEIYDLTFSRDAKRIAVVRGKTLSNAVILSTNGTPTK